MLSQQGEELTGHEGRERLDPARLDPDPFAVGSGQHQEALAQFEQRQRAEHLRFLAAHDVRHALLFATQAGHDGDAAGLHPGQVRRDVGEAGWASAVGRFQPTLPAAGHAADQGQGRPGAHPVAASSVEYGRELARRHIENAARQRPLFNRAAMAIEQRRPQGRGAPIQRDQPLHSSALTCSGQGSGATAPKPCTAIAAAALA